MRLEMEDYQKSLQALQTKLAEKEKAFQDSQDEVSRVDKRADDFKTQIGENNWTDWTLHSKKNESALLDTFSAVTSSRLKHRGQINQNNRTANVWLCEHVLFLVK